VRERREREGEKGGRERGREREGGRDRRGRGGRGKEVFLSLQYNVSRQALLDWKRKKKKRYLNHQKKNYMSPSALSNCKSRLNIHFL
jgi:hypothetical protein